MKSVLPCFIFINLLLACAAFAAETTATSVELPRVLQVPATDASVMIRQIDLKVALQQYEALRTEQYQMELRLAFIRAGAENALPDAERQAFERDIKVAANEQDKGDALNHYEQAKAVARQALEERTAILHKKCEEIQDAVQRLSSELEKVGNEPVKCKAAEKQ